MDCNMPKGCMAISFVHMWMRRDDGQWAWWFLASCLSYPGSLLQGGGTTPETSHQVGKLLPPSLSVRSLLPPLPISFLGSGKNPFIHNILHVDLSALSCLLALFQWLWIIDYKEVMRCHPCSIRSKSLSVEETGDCYSSPCSSELSVKESPILVA